MQTRDIPMEILIEVLAPAPSLAVAEGRIQSADLATIPDPIFPLVTIHRDTGGFQDTSAPLTQVDFVIISNSLLGLDEAFAMHGAIANLLDHQAFSKDGCTIALLLTHGPMTQTLDSPTPISRVIGIFTARVFNG